MADQWFAVLIVDTLHEKRPLVKKTQNPVFLLNSLNNSNDLKMKVVDNACKEKENLDFFLEEFLGNYNSTLLHSSARVLLSFPTDTFMHVFDSSSLSSATTAKKILLKKKKPAKKRRKLVQPRHKNNYCAKCRGTVGKITQPMWNVNGRYKIGQINGPFATEKHVDNFLAVWLTGTRGTISKAARAEILSKYFGNECYGDLGVIFLDENVYECFKCSC